MIESAGSLVPGLLANTDIQPQKGWWMYRPPSRASLAPTVLVFAARIVELEADRHVFAGRERTMVENDLGADIARKVARKRVIYQRRGTEQSQLSTLLELDPQSDRVRLALVYARENLKSDLSIEALADMARLSPGRCSEGFTHSMRAEVFAARKSVSIRPAGATDATGVNIMKVPGPDHPITITAAAELIVVSFHGQEIARSTRALALAESTYPTAFYIPREDARMEQMSASEHHTWCPYKGEASYYSLAEVAGDGLNAVWSYEEPYPAMEQIRGHLAFYRQSGRNRPHAPGLIEGVTKVNATI